MCYMSLCHIYAHGARFIRTISQYKYRDKIPCILRIRFIQSDSFDGNALVDRADGFYGSTSIDEDMQKKDRNFIFDSCSPEFRNIVVKINLFILTVTVKSASVKLNAKKRKNYSRNIQYMYIFSYL